MNYHAMSKADLEAELGRLQSDLDDLTETIHFNLAYSSAHIGGGQVRKDEATLRELEEEVGRIKEYLSKR